MSHKFKVHCALLLAVCSLVSACSATPKPITEAPPPSPVATVEQQHSSNLPPPQLKQVQEALKRVFKDAVVVDTSRKPAFIMADFNGDRSQDIAVVLMPVSEKLPELNEEFPTWMLRDPFGPIEKRSPRLRIADKEVLLAVIHGYGVNGWRDQQATQTYLLKNSSGAGMEAHSLKDFTNANQGKSMPRLSGDVLREVLNNKPGYLYYANATYSWYDPKSFKPEPEQRMVHAPIVEAGKK